MTIFTENPSRKMFSFPIFLLNLLFLVLLFQFSNAHIFSLEMHHRFSEPVKKWSLKSGENFPDPSWKNSVEYYAHLASRDRLLHRRRLSDADGVTTFSEGNSTSRISSLGFLHYTTVSLGTPAMKFMVALDTGSDLFWVPCDCERCSAVDNPLRNSDSKFSIYNTSASSTSKKVTCSDSLCAHHGSCADAFTHCPYSVSYVTPETSTSGILVEDLLHLKAEDGNQELIEAYITFGCGQVQTGSFLDVAAPNGLFGLGFENISVPSLLSQEGYMANSFSMCFGHDGRGRINFGDTGSLDQEETPFNVNPLHPSYNVTVTQIRVGTTLIYSEFTALFDSGTSFTYLVDPTYSSLLETFHFQAQDKRRIHHSRIPFEYCYAMSPDANSSLIPTVSLGMKGGGQLIIYDPIIIISTQEELAYCLAVVKSEDFNIIGQNFMTGYRMVFDREKLVLGWKKFDCYDTEESTKSKPQNSASMLPALAVGIGNDSATKSGRNSGISERKSVASSAYHVLTFCSICLCLILQFFVSPLS